MNISNLKQIAKEWKKGDEHRFYFDAKKIERQFPEIIEKHKTDEIEPSYSILDVYYNVGTNKFRNPAESAEYREKYAPIRADFFAAIREFCEIPK